MSEAAKEVTMTTSESIAIEVRDDQGHGTDELNPNPLDLSGAMILDAYVSSSVTKNDVAETRVNSHPTSAPTILKSTTQKLDDSSTGKSKGNDMIMPKLLRSSSAPVDSRSGSDGHYIIDNYILEHSPKSGASACSAEGDIPASSSPTAAMGKQNASPSYTRTNSDPTSNRSHAAKVASPIPVATFHKFVQGGISGLFNQAGYKAPGENSPRSMSLKYLNDRNKKLVIETFYCKICCENIKKDHSEPKKWFFVCSHEHIYCKDCLEQWCHTQINDGVIHLHCPDYKECHEEVQEHDLPQIVAATYMEKFVHLKKMRLNPNFRECPSCDTGCMTGNVSYPEITCEKCCTKYCYIHNNAHTGKSCEEYMKTLSVRVLKDMQASENLIKNGMKACPQCKSPTEKNGGCNHMTCRFCRSDWCWICEKQLSDIHGHYNGLLSGCSGMQFVDTRAADQASFFCVQTCGRYASRLFLIMMRIFQILIAIIDYSIALVWLSTIFAGFVAHHCGIGFFTGIIPKILRLTCCADNGTLNTTIGINETICVYLCLFIGVLVGISFWLASACIIIGPLLLYIGTLIFANSFCAAGYSWEDLREIFMNGIFHVPIFLSQFFPNDS